MRTMLNTILGIAFFAAAYQVVWSINAMPNPQPAAPPAPVPIKQDKPVEFDEAYRRYVEHLVHTKYADRIPLEEERVQRHLSIIKEQLEAQQRIIEEARR